MKLIRVWRSMPPLVYEQANLLQKEVTELLDHQGLAVSEETRRECLLFILWSVHVGLINMRPGIVRSALQWLHKRKIEKKAQAEYRRLLTQYERRRIEALYVVKNVFAKRTAQGWEIPLSLRSARMFLNNATGEAKRASTANLDDVLLILRRRSATCIGTLLAA